MSVPVGARRASPKQNRVAMIRGKLDPHEFVRRIPLAPHGMLGPMRPPVDVTYLADTVLALRYYEADGAVHKAISVIKKRTGTHEATIREVVVGYRHITIGRPLTDFRGIFTGTPQPERPARKSGARAGTEGGKHRPKDKESKNQDRARRR